MLPFREKSIEVGLHEPHKPSCGFTHPHDVRGFVQIGVQLSVLVALLKKNRKRIINVLT